MCDCKIVKDYPGEYIEFCPLHAHAEELLNVARELIGDVERSGKKGIARDWPDLYVTYNNANRIIAKCEGALKTHKEGS